MAANPTRYTMRLDVRAWQVAPDGSLPDEAREAITRNPYNGQWEDRGYWVWYFDYHYQTAYPGDWIVSHEYGLEAMRDEAFRECCTEVDPEPAVLD
ncbi:MAG: hypothetical protein WBA46_14835 [Thermomicrobiales bacterium]